MKKTIIIAHGLMVLSIILAATSFPVGVLITNELPPVDLMFARFLAAALLFSPYVFIKNGLRLPSLNKIFKYSMLSIPLVVFFWCMFESLRYTNVINTGAIYTLVPVITAIFAFFINKERIKGVHLFGLVLGTIGAVWIVFKGDYNSLIRMELNYGDFIFTLGCFFLGLYNPLVKKIYSGERMEVMTFWVLLSGAMWLLIASRGSVFQVDWINIGSKVYIGILYLSLFSTLVTFFLLQKGVIILGATNVAAYGFLTPIFIIVISLVLGMAKFEIGTYPGVLVVITAMFIIQYNPGLKVIKK